MKLVDTVNDGKEEGEEEEEVKEEGEEDTSKEKQEVGVVTEKEAEKEENSGTASGLIRVVASFRGISVSLYMDYEEIASIGIEGRVLV